MGTKSVPPHLRGQKLRFDIDIPALYQTILEKNRLLQLMQADPFFDPLSIGLLF